MRIEKGAIYLANLGNSSMHDIGKIRPVLVFQNNFLNRMIDESTYKDVIIIPLSSQIRENDFTLKLDVRDKLEKESVILCNAIKIVSADRLLLENGKLTMLRKNEIEQIETILRLLFDM
jgi:mRNA-degrading endonuclease toxin of MazEF toxin-antitoxin module